MIKCVKGGFLYIYASAPEGIYQKGSEGLGEPAVSVICGRRVCVCECVHVCVVCARWMRVHAVSGRECSLPEPYLPDKLQALGQITEALCPHLSTGGVAASQAAVRTK